MPTDNPSFVLHGIEKVAYEDRPIPEIKDDEVLIEVKKTGICGSDVHYLVHGRIGDFAVKSPMVLGHESAGIISKVGKSVTRVKPGDRVAMEPGISCRTCDDLVFAATPPYDGTLARYYRLPADLVYPLPDNLTLEDGAMAIAVHSVSTLAGLKPNQTIAVFGCGPVGLLCMAVAKAFGASRIVAVDIVPARLEFAKSYAATETYLPPAPEAGESKIAYSERSADLMKKQLGIEERGEKAIDLVLDASGAEVSIQTGLFISKIGGTFVQVGMGMPEITIPISLFLSKELTMKGSFRYGSGDYRLAVALASHGKIDLKPMVTHRFAFTDAVAAFNATKAGRTEDGRALIKAIISGPDTISGRVKLHAFPVAERILSADIRFECDTAIYNYQFAYFFRKTEPHAVLVKSLEQSRNFVLDNNPPPPPPVPKPSDSKSQTSKRKHRRSANKEINETSKKRKMQGKQRSREGNEHAMETSVEDVIEADDHAEAAVTPSVTSRRSARAKKPIVGGYREQDEDAIMDEEWENPPNVLGQGRRTQAIVTQTSNAIGSSAQGGDGGSSTDAVVIKDEVDEPALASPVYGPPEASDVTMEGTAASSAIPRDPDMVIEIEDDEEPKPKLSLRLQYQGFSIYGRCLCVIVEPWPSLKSASRAPSLAPPGISSLRPKSIAPPEFVPSRAETPGQRARTPLFLPDFDREMSAAPGPSRLRTSLHPALEREDGNGFGSNIDDDNAGLMAFSQVLSATAETGRAVEDDDDFEGAVFFADADEAREL
ncbi:hypothetical protein EW146_g5503 [Bondarzewia mesenterica]|uniref:Enoyl reductase (ER) domain-containing protein n=1 Tax=Bondarzewia mesenterica TaxID=1095465 RepID=A0A4S4LRC2_9AGAM|nr:hypothetical protein EW146_g5503 [Bondarzewia mesenterica]